MRFLSVRHPVAFYSKVISPFGKYTLSLTKYTTERMAINPSKLEVNAISSFVNTIIEKAAVGPCL
ncbi:unnamed protein product [Penicillium camemberti]|uniref:Str. FM013 n=1 Tax=Penicillium camemberti (strain FM 013) TaxID=1429867 RepID=A0A0G4PMM3_PENC3|nr:unnamed protein product [Penicillium camemberti]